MAHRKPKIFITGGTGFVGAYLIRALLDRGYSDITALRRKSSKTELLGDLEDRVSWIEGDVLEVLEMEEYLRGADWVFHCAAVVSHEPGAAARMKKVNAGGTANVVNACLAVGVKKLIYTSSIAALNREKHSKTLDEQSFWTPESPITSQYGLSKYLAEQEVWRGGAEGLNIVIANPSVIIGSGYWSSPTPGFFRMVSKGLRFYPEGSTGFVDVRDVARGLIKMAESKRSNERFILSGENLSYLQFFSLIAHALEKNVPSIKINQYLALTGARLIQPIFRVLGKKSPLPVDTARVTGFQNAYANRKSVELLGLEYTPIAETISETAAQMHEAKSRDWKPKMLPIPI